MNPHSTTTATSYPEIDIKDQVNNFSPSYSATKHIFLVFTDVTEKNLVSLIATWSNIIFLTLLSGAKIHP